MADEQKKKPDRPPAVGTYDANPVLRELNRRAEETSKKAERVSDETEGSNSGGSEE